MNDVFNILVPILGLGLIGYCATKLGFFSQTNREGLAKYVFDFAVPILLFVSVVQLEIPAKSTLKLFGSYYIPLVIAFLFAAIVSRIFLRKQIIESLVIGLGSCFSNGVLLGIPLIPRALGEESLYPLFLILSIHGISVFTAITVAIEIARGKDAGLKSLPKQVMLGLITNPLIIGLVSGFAWKSTSIGLHPLLIELFDLVAKSVTPAALFVLGSSLAGYRIFGSLGPAVLVTTTKNIIHPLMVFGFGNLFELNSLWLSVAVLLAAMPAGMNMYLFATRYEITPPVATSSIFISTLLSIITLSIVIALV